MGSSLKMNEVTIYGTKHCTYCDMAKKVCENNSLPFVYVDIEETPEVVTDLLDTIGPFRTVPQIFVDNEYVGGFDNFKKVVNGNTD